MSIETADRWADVLWSYFSSQIEADKRFFLAADEQLIHSLQTDQERSCTTVLKSANDFHEACYSLLHRTRKRASVKSIAFNQIPNRSYSRVICLAVQQVLVVELMLQDEEHMFTERSYFPRYRERLCLEKPYPRSCPLGKSEFQRIWSTLEEELISNTSLTRSMIAFKPGTGIDVNRALPMSQALFTTHDLSSIRKLATSRITEKSKETDVLLFLSSIAQELGPRARNLIKKSSSDRQAQLIRQVLSFLHRRPRFSVLERKVKRTKDDSILVAFREIDLFDDKDVLSVYLERGANQLAGPAVHEALDTRTTGNQLVLLVSKADSKDDRYVEVRAKELLNPDDTLIALCRTSYANQFCEFCSREYDTQPELIESNLLSQYSVYLCGLAADAKILDLAGLGVKEPDDKLALLGGLYADKLRRTYLTGYPPRGVQRGSVTVSREMHVFVNDKQIELGVFLDELESVTEYSEYNLQIDDKDICFRIATFKPLDIHEQINLGYPLNERTELSPVAIPFQIEADALRGAVLTSHGVIPNKQAPVTLSTNDVALLLRKGQRIALNSFQQQSIKQALAGSTVNRQISSLAIGLILTTRSIPFAATASPTIRLILEAS